VHGHFGDFTDVAIDWIIRHFDSSVAYLGLFLQLLLSPL
jgi:hypothetical protein